MSRISHNGENLMECVNDNNLAIAWIGLTYHVKTGIRRKPKVIINNINGSVDFRTLTAIMGPSGSGKTTLLKCINGWQVKGIDGNTIIYSNRNTDIKSCFISQDVKEHLLTGLTVSQSVVYASKLKNRIKGFRHELNARNILMSLNITNTANTSVEKCSGGEQKRLAIALELTAKDKPNLLCIDEPTSGLDSCAAEEVIQCLKNLTENNVISVVTSIHQPNNDIICLFDKLYVMSISGHAIFEGSPEAMVDHLESVGIELNDELAIEVLIPHVHLML